MTKTAAKAHALRAIAQVRLAGRVRRDQLQAHLGLDDAGFETAIAAAGSRLIRVRGQGGGFFPA